MAVASSLTGGRKIFFFLPPGSPDGGDLMYVTWEVLFLFGTFVIGLIKLVLDISNNKKK